MDFPILFSPKLIIVEHTSIAEEKFAKNGEQKNVHVVVKNTPFFITVAFIELHPKVKVDFNNVTIEALLMYDCEGERFVDFVKNKPLEYKGMISDKGDKMTLEIRIKKLSSHLEDMFFKIRIKGVDSVSKKDLPLLYATSQPIKVVSKPEQITKFKEGQIGKPISQQVRPKKRNLSDMMFDSVQKIQQQQHEQLALLRKLSERSNECSPFIKNEDKDSSATISKLLMNNSLRFSKSDIVTPEDELESSLHTFIKAFESIDPAERPTKIRKMIRSIPVRALDTLSEITSQLQYSLKDNTVPETIIKVEEIFPKPEDVLKTEKIDASSLSLEEIQRVDEFYRDLLFSSNTAGLFS